MSHGVTPQQEDWMEKRFESFVQTINTLMQENTEKTVKAVEAQIKVTVNGKIDKIKEQLDKQDLVLQRLDIDTSPLIKVKNGAVGSMKVLLYLAGVVTVLGGAYLVLKNIF